VLRFGELGAGTTHVCVDMQRIFADDTEWHTPWMERVLPRVVALAEAQPERTVFTRFIPAPEPGRGAGTWRRYYERWGNMTLARLGDGMVDLVPPLARLAPPAPIVDKAVYSPWFGGELQRRLGQLRTDTLVVSGLETEVCVLATVLGAVDFGYRVVIATDAICSSADSTHDAMLEIYGSRFGMQVETATTEEILDALA
jgi:nicotinamidase-related amidase